MTDMASIRKSLDLYVDEGVPLGGFLTAVVCNDLKEAFGRADMANRHQMFEIVDYLYNECPATCWGSKKRHEAWMAMHAKRRLDESEQ
jgi:hypothetical protein